MTKRKLQKAFKRITHIPKGINFFKYIGNKSQTVFLAKTKSLKVAYPSSIMIELTNHCNIKCITCAREYAFGDAMAKGFMDFEKFKSIIDEIYPYVDSIGLTGLGETFLYKRIDEATDYIKSKNKGIIISASINAHLPKSIEMAKKIAGKIDTIQISIDGIGEVYNIVRKLADFEFFLANTKGIIEVTKDTHTDTMFNMVVLKENYHQMSEMLKFTNDLGIRYLNIIPMNIVSRTDLDNSYYDFYLTKEFKEEYFKTKDLAKNYLDVELTFYEFEEPASFRKCRFIWNYFYITWDGYVPPCCAKPFPLVKSFGNVFEKPLIEILNTDDYQDFRQSWFEEKDPEFCDKCFNMNLPEVKRDVTESQTIPV